jgi:voltage-gated potassium channel Kch
MAGLTVAQISEFSIIFVGMGVAAGHVDEAALGLVTLVGLITITGSTYMILYSEPLYRLLEKPLGLLERATRNGKEGEETGDTADALVFGVGRYGARLAHRLCESGWNAMGVDIDPARLDDSAPYAFDVVYGDVCDTDFLAQLPLSSAKWVISTLRGLDADLAVIAALRGAGYEGRIAVTAHSDDEAERLRHAGADEIFQPLHNAADHAANWLADGDRRAR